METIRATFKVIPQISYTCPKCDKINRYTRQGTEKPETVECSGCRAVYAPIWKD